MNKTLTQHEAIKDWAEANKMQPAVVHDENEKADTSLLRFTEEPNEELHAINWEHFFELFDKNNLALVVEEDSKFNKFVSKESDA